MKEFWNSRYAEEGFAYGSEPNVFYKSQIDLLTPGKALFVAEGEGRNAVYAATLGWDVTAFDISEHGLTKAKKLAESKGVNIQYDVANALDLPYEEKSFDLIVFVYTHFPEGIKKQIFKNLVALLKPNGRVIFECFSKDHLQYNENNNSGGPREESLLYSLQEVEELFSGFESSYAMQEVIILKEGVYHDGEGSVVRYVALRASLKFEV
jgi:ubiquinone/menaquinone biosynthesis C-methylase UbiE